MHEERIKVALSGVMSDFYHQVMEKRFDSIEKHIDDVDQQLSDLRQTSTALVKIVDYARLEAKVMELEDRLKKLEG